MAKRDGLSHEYEGISAAQRRWRWTNVPLPEPHLGFLALGGLLHVLLPKRLLPTSRPAQLVGWPLAATGIFLAAWSVRAAGTSTLAKPDEVITDGPYRRSRNPMYVAWTLIYVGVGFIVNTAWLFVCLPAMLAIVHAIVLREERVLAQRFGSEYAVYRAGVRRYL